MVEVHTYYANKEEQKLNIVSGTPSLRYVAGRLTDAGVGFAIINGEIRFRIFGKYAVRIAEEPEGSGLMTVENAFRNTIYCRLSPEQAANAVIASDRIARRSNPCRKRAAI